MPSRPLSPSRSSVPSAAAPSAPLARPHCSIVPPYMLETLAASDDPLLAAQAQATLDVEAELLPGRRTAGLRPDRPRTVRPRLAPGTSAGPVRSIYDAKHGTTLPGLLVRSEGQPPTGDQGVTEAYDGLGATWQLWQQAYGRNSLDGKGLPLVASVHFSTDYDNAFWDGTQMVFGDGDGVIFLPFTRSVDVIGHELAHGVTQYTSGLNYQDQSGALNESVSDVFGVLVKQRLLGQTADQADWLVGAELLAPGVNGVALRSMAAPGTAYDDPRLGKDPQPAHMSGYVDTADDNGGVHINSGIPNKAFHVVATTLGGHAWEVAGQVWFDTITGDISADCDFATFARLTVAAATARHGAGSEVVGAVKAGWDAVGLGTAAPAPSVPATTATPAPVEPGPTPTPQPQPGPTPTPAPQPAPSPTPGPATQVSVRRTGGLAGRTVERTVALGDLPTHDARAWHSLLADDGLPALAEQLADRPQQPDTYCYGVQCEVPALDVQLPELELPDEVRSLLERTLGPPATSENGRLRSAHDRARAPRPAPRALRRPVDESRCAGPTTTCSGTSTTPCTSSCSTPRSITGWCARPASTSVSPRCSGSSPSRRLRYFARSARSRALSRSGCRWPASAAPAWCCTLGLFVAAVETAAHLEWVQVYIDRESRRPTPVPDVARAAFDRCLAGRVQ